MARRQSEVTSEAKTLAQSLAACKYQKYLGDGIKGSMAVIAEIRGKIGKQTKMQKEGTVVYRFTEIYKCIDYLQLYFRI